MKKSESKGFVDSFVNRGLVYIDSKHKDAVSRVTEAIASICQAYAANQDSMAMLDWDSFNKKETPSCLCAPSVIRYGDLLLQYSKGPEDKDIIVPLLLPTTSNAVVIDLGKDSEKGPSLFQNLILRLLLSMRMTLLKVSVVDMDFGASFPLVSAISNSLFKNQLIYRQEDVTKLVDELAKEISVSNRAFMGRCPDIDHYNASAGDMALPYHFVFIDDFPNGFTPQSIDVLLRLIDNGNAARAGIKIFLNYSEKNQSPRDFDINRFAKSCSWIKQDKEGSITLTNWNYDLPPHTTVSLDLTAPDKTDDIIDFINGIRPRAVSYSLDGWIEDLKKNDQIWKGSTSDGIRVPIGFIRSGKTFDFYMANDNDVACNDFFALIAGRPGYGKTVLLHNIIVNAAMKYSPDELCLYLADFAEGASFSIYRELPHVKSLMLANNKEYALRMLDDVVLEAKKRSHLYQKAQKKYGKQIINLSSYRDITGEKLPRVLFVMDEFHTLFFSTDNTTIRAKETLCNGIRQWRKFGISIILCTQSINGVNFGSADTQITYRFALNLLEMDSKSVIRNDAAKTLTRKGQTIMNNTADGRIESNVEFQSAYSSHYLEHVNYLIQLYSDKYGIRHKPFICEAGTDADIIENQTLVNAIIDNNTTYNNLFCDVFVGKPDLLRDSHTRIRYRRQQNSHTLIIGDDFKTLIYDIMVQLIQLKNQSHPSSRFYLLDCFNVGDAFKGCLNGLYDFSESFSFSDPQKSKQVIEDVYKELDFRRSEQMEGRMTEERIVLTILNAQNCYDLKPQPARFGMEQSEVSKQLISILTEGAQLGIHVIMHGLSYESLFKTSGILESNKHYSLFENLILLKGADVGNMFLGGLKINAPEESEQMIVVNAKIDGEPYEQCNAYSDLTIEKRNRIVDFMSDIFDKLRYA